MNETILFHGSHGGIEGDITPISRARCDFGQGFYLSSNPLMAKRPVVDDPAPVFYEIGLDLSAIPEDKILRLDDDDWIYAVVSLRNNIPEFKNLKKSKEVLDRINNTWIVCGHETSITINEAVRSFKDCSLTDEGLKACLMTMDCGMQYTLKTEEACNTSMLLDFLFKC